jgi:hypothetical protein
MQTVREPAVAGTFYPDNPGELRAAVSGYLATAQSAGAFPKAIIAPHAGYIYSGPVAASAYARMAPGRETIRRVVLLGPAHRIGFSGLAVPSADTFRTPLGSIPVDQQAISRIKTLPQVTVLDAAHAREHSLEVQLPFLQQVIANFRLVPLVAGDATADEVAEALELLWGGPETLIVISSDLSHYHDYDTANRLDRATTQAIEQLRPQQIRYDDACGRVPVIGLLTVAQRRGLHATTLDVRNSGDTAGPRDSVVGYGAWAFD